jgi:hypothetical protein
LRRKPRCRWMSDVRHLEKQKRSVVCCT